MSNPNWKLSDDKSAVILTIPTDPPTIFKMDAKGVDEMLAGLGMLRSCMEPAYPADFSLGQVVHAVPDPRWVTEPDAIAGNTIIHLRDPRFGWLHYLIPREVAAALATYLQAQVAQPLAPGPGQAH